MITHVVTLYGVNRLPGSPRNDQEGGRDPCHPSPLTISAAYTKSRRSQTSLTE